MNSIKIKIFVLMLLLSHIAFAKKNILQWELSGGRGVLNENRISTAHFLRNTLINKFLVFGGPYFGIELGWTSKVKGTPYINSKSVRIRTLASENKRKYVRDHRDKIRHDFQPLKYSELCAIEITGAVKQKSIGYLKYKKRKYGINLVYSRHPSYEWKITGGGSGKPVRSLDSTSPSPPVGIYNTKAKDHLVYCSRKYGVNLRWAGDCKHKGKVRQKVVDHRKGK